jgi:hypothetical protein
VTDEDLKTMNASRIGPVEMANLIAESTVVSF